MFLNYFFLFRSKHEKLTFKCLFCDKSLSTKQKLTQHILLLHENEDYLVNIEDEEEEEEEAEGSKRIKLSDEYSNGIISTSGESASNDIDIFNNAELELLGEIDLDDLEFLYKEEI